MFDPDTVYGGDKESDVDIFKDGVKVEESSSVQNQNTESQLPDTEDSTNDDTSDIESNNEAVIDSTDTSKSYPEPSNNHQLEDSTYDGDIDNSDGAMDSDDSTQDYTITYNLDSNSLEPIKKIKRPKRTTTVFHPEFPTTYDMEDFKLKKSTCIPLPKGYTQETIKALIEKNEMEKEESSFEEPVDTDDIDSPPMMIEDDLPEIPEINPAADNDDSFPPEVPDEVHFNDDGDNGIIFPSDDDTNVDINDFNDINDDSVTGDNDLDITTTLDEDLILQLSDEENRIDQENSDPDRFSEDPDIKDDIRPETLDSEVIDSLLGKDLSREERARVIKLVKLKLGMVIQEASKALTTLKTVKVKRSQDEDEEGSTSGDYEIGTEKTEEIVKRDATASSEGTG